MQNQRDERLKPIIDLVKEIKTCEAAGAITAATALSYICIDTLAYWSAPRGQENVTKDDFIEWVDHYLKGDASQPYKYSGVDLYAARCAVLHNWGAEAQSHRNDSSIPLFGYSNGGSHQLNPEVSERMVIIGVASLINDLVIAIESFLCAAESDDELRARMGSRIDKVMANFPFPRKSES